MKAKSKAERLVHEAFASVQRVNRAAERVVAIPFQLDPSWSIVDVIDTRDWVREDRGWVPVSDSGDWHRCDHCNTQHVIHVKIAKYDDKHQPIDTKIIGFNCAKKLMGGRYTWKPMLEQAQKRARKISFEKWKKSQPPVPLPPVSTQPQLDKADQKEALDALAHAAELASQLVGRDLVGYDEYDEENQDWRIAAHKLDEYLAEQIKRVARATSPHAVPPPVTKKKSTQPIDIKAAEKIIKALEPMVEKALAVLNRNKEAIGNAVLSSLSHILKQILPDLLTPGRPHFY